jgi:hypothetical protein
MHSLPGMTRLACVAVGAVLWISMAPSGLAQEVRIELPSIRFEAPPPLVVVEPGIEVVPDQPDEVFYVDGWYWTRRDGRWFRTRDYRGQWVVAERRIVPERLFGVPEGRYRRWHGERRHEERREERREERHEERR